MEDFIFLISFGVIWALAGIIVCGRVSKSLYNEEIPLHILICAGIAGPAAAIVSFIAWVQQRGWKVEK